MPWGSTEAFLADPTALFVSHKKLPKGVINPPFSGKSCFAIRASCSSDKLDLL